MGIKAPYPPSPYPFKGPYENMNAVQVAPSPSGEEPDPTALV